MRKILSFTTMAGLLLVLTVRADEQADLKAVIDKAIQASGGEAKLGKYKGGTFKAKGTVHRMGEIAFTAEGARQVPDRYRAEFDADINGMKFKIIRVINGDKGWMKINEEVQELDQDVVKEEKEGLYHDYVCELVPLKDKAYHLAPLGDGKVGDKETLGIKVSHKNHRDVNLYFDKKSGHLVKSEMRIVDEESKQEVNQESFYSEFKDFDGIKVATKLTIKRDDKPFIEMEFTEFKLVEKLDDNLFSKP